MPARPTLRWPWLLIVPPAAFVVTVAVGLLQGATSSQDGGAAYAKREKPDPVVVNGKIFEGWPKPDVAVLFSAEQDGYIEPCGCTGLENQKGGLKRRFTLLKQLRDKGWPLVAIDGGGQEKYTGKQG